MSYDACRVLTARERVFQKSLSTVTDLASRAQITRTIISLACLAVVIVVIVMVAVGVEAVAVAKEVAGAAGAVAVAVAVAA